MGKFLKVLERFGSKKWYGLLVAVLAALDAFILIIPTDALLLSAVFLRKRQWLLIAIGVALGSALGSALFVVLVTNFGEPFLDFLIPGILQSKTWADTTAFLNDYSTTGLFLLSASPLPQQPALAIVGLAHVSFWTVVFSVFSGRLVKYLLLSACAAFAPGLLAKIPFLERNQKVETPEQ